VMLAFMQEREMELVAGKGAPHGNRRLSEHQIRVSQTPLRGSANRDAELSRRVGGGRRRSAPL
jgi:hypothetical protein